MKKLNALAIASVILASSCSIFESEEREKPKIIYTDNNLPKLEASISEEDAITKREEIVVPSVSAEVSGVETTETIVINKDTITEPSNNVTVTRIRIEDENVTSDIAEASNDSQTSNVIEATQVAQVTESTEDFGSDSQPNEEAEVGQCYGKVKIAGTFKEVMEKVVVQPERIEKKTIPAKYNFVDEEVVVREETEKYIEIPATYKIVTEQVVVEPEKKKITTIPAKYKTVQERVMVAPASKVWKKGRGLIERTGSDGEIMCLVEEPAKYEMVEKQVLVEPERQEVSIIPAVTKIITKEVIDRPARVEKTIVPAVKKRIPKKVLVEAEKTMDVKIPAVYKTVAKKVPVTPNKITWRPVLCDYNITPSVIMKLQEALTLRGYDTGGIDGVFGSRTANAVNTFQKSLGMESSGITLETLRALGVSY